MIKQNNILEIFNSGLERVKAKGMIEQALQLTDQDLIVKSTDCVTYTLSDYSNVYVLSIGKAAIAMAEGVYTTLGEKIAGGLIITKEGLAQSIPLNSTLRSKFSIEEGNHPIPAEKSELAAKLLTQYAKKYGAQKNSLIIVLISGGASALLCAPVSPITRTEKAQVTQALLASGATIQEINCLRKHLSTLKGGQLAKMLYPASVLGLILSDVVGDDLDVIASGMTVADRSTFQMAQEVIHKYKLANSLPQTVLTHIQNGLTGKVPETPKINDVALSTTKNFLVGSNILALQAAKQRAENLGYTTIILSAELIGEAREVGQILWGICATALKGLCTLKVPLCILAGGETTVQLRGKGRGGRNQELALAFLKAMQASNLPAAKLHKVHFLSGATDGGDGPTDAAGAIVDYTALTQAEKLDLNLQNYLQDNDSYTVMEKLNKLIKIGQTGTNVCDIQILLIDGDAVL